MALRAAVNPSNNAFGGGTLTRAGQPTAVGGSLGNPGAAGFTSPGTPAILSARNNQGSNVRIPYARVVPLHAKDALPVKDLALIGSGQKTAFEYDGLESGELAWVLGKQFPVKGVRYPQTVEYSVLAAQMPRSAPGSAGAAVNNRYPAGHPQAGQLRPGFDATGASSVPHLQPSGYGPDRMQRLAYTAWIESHFIARTGRQTIDLKAFDMFSSTATALDSELEFWKTHGAAGADLFAVPDLAYAYQTPTSDPVKKPLQIAASATTDAAMPQGLFVMERGPFLRSIGTDHRAVNIQAVTESGELFIHNQSVNRHLGSDLAQKGLEVALKENGVFNWIPDGICLSKYETGPNEQANAEHDARSSQLFNVAVQGPAITKTWTHDPKMQCMPMDKVFVLVVADLAYTISGAGANVNGSRDSTAALRNAVREPTGKQRLMTAAAVTAAKNGYAAPAPGGAAPDTELRFNDWIGRTGTLPAAGAAFVSVTAAAGGAAPAEGDGILLVEQLVREDDGSAAATAGIARARERAKDLWAAYRLTFGFGPAAAAAPKSIDELLADNDAGFDANAAALRNGSKGVDQAKLSNFRLMRATSSFLSQYSHYNGDQTLSKNKSKDERDSRCGLPIFFNGATGSGGASYIVGGWCIGTVVDSAASRSVFNNVVRTAPASMALNVSVNVEWWNADKLYQHYMDTEKYTKSTAALGPAVAVPANTTPNKFTVEDAATLGANAPTDAVTMLAAGVLASNLAGTVSERGQIRESTSDKYSMDLDVEAYPTDMDRAVAARAVGDRFRRGWTGMPVPA